MKTRTKQRKRARRDDMDFSFERGSAENPKGHALIYFHNSQDADEVLATYLVILPIQVDLSKYVPPFLMNQLPDSGPSNLSSFAFPPAPEPVSGAENLHNLAKARDDDVIYGGSVSSSDIASLLGAVNDAIGWYSDLCAELHPTENAAAQLPESEEGGEVTEGLNVNDVMYELMSDQDKLGELTQMVGRTRDAVSTGNFALADEIQADIVSLGRHLPENHQVTRLAEAAASRDADAGRLANLYLQRCFHLMAEEYVMLGKVEDEIRGIEGK